jgi:hypothetical protein
MISCDQLEDQIGFGADATKNYLWEIRERA